ncbi:hypothetical protein [Clostridium transplantifaecale]|uniref:hypothetical protein n=1 Tax=Clostridium transplantifaecale TaxID=2479838 RepID=UPI000F6424B8|nr:hypothetical protein [Clostridium transplantifaecale]
MRWDRNDGMELFLDISPDTVSSSRSEPCEAKNSLVFQLHNTSGQELSLQNEEMRTNYNFLPLEQAEPIAGLTMVYLVFPLGSGDGCLTTAERFKKIRLSCPDSFAVKAVDDHTLVFFPVRTLSFSTYDIAEFMIQDLVTELPSGNSSVCRAVLFSSSGKMALNSSPIHIVRHPLQIPIFKVAPGFGCASFGDRIRFQYRVMGADSCVFTPGDEEMEKNGRLMADGTYESVLYRKTGFTLVAARGEAKISRVFELTPLTAKIKNFSAAVSPAGKDGGNRTVTLTFTVENTRHVFLSRAGRIEVESGVEQTVVLDCDREGASYTLSVENADGLVSESRVACS